MQSVEKKFFLDPAITYYYCGLPNHFSKKCHKPSRKVQTEDDGDIYYVHYMHGGQDAKITFKVDKKENMGHVPFKTYAKITDDKTGKNLESSSVRLVMHNQSEEKVQGKVHFRLERKGKAHKLLFLVIDYDTIPLLGKKARKKMGLIKILVN